MIHGQEITTPTAPHSEAPAHFKDLPVLSFASQAAWRAWLAVQPGDSKGIWLRIFKKASGISTVTYAQALDESLCYGWIDSTKNAYDAESFVQRFTPRKKRSPWSKVNRDHVARLIAAGAMAEAGLAAIAVAKDNGQWEAAYDSASTATVPDDFQAVLDQHPAAWDFWNSLNQANRYAFLYRIQTVKRPETRIRRIAWALDLLARQEKIH